MKRRSFTILELMICILILAAIAGVLGWQVKSMVDEYRFKAYGQELKDELEKLQILAMTYRSDMKFEIRKQKGEWVAISRTEEPALMRKVNHTRHFSQLQNVVSEQIKGESFNFNIFATGRIEPKGVLKLVRGEKYFYVDLSNPLQIVLSKQLPKEIKPKLPEKPTFKERKDEDNKSSF